MSAPPVREGCGEGFFAPLPTPPLVPQSGIYDRGGFLFCPVPYLFYNCDTDFSTGEGLACPALAAGDEGDRFGERESQFVF